MKFVMPIEGQSAEQLYNLNRTGAGGFYPIGLNNSYHGGMHFEGEKLPVVAIADGTIVAYRLTNEYIEERVGDKPYKYSNSFVLIKHAYKTPKGQEFTFYSHYNHLVPWNEMKRWVTKNDRFPHLVMKPGFEVKKDGVRVRSSPEVKSDNLLPRALKAKENVLASPVREKKGWAKIEGSDEYFNYEQGRAVPENVVCIPECDKVVSCENPVKAGELIGYSGLCEAEGAPERYAAVHVEVFADDDAEDFINNVKVDGKPTLLKIAEGKVLKRRNKVYTDLSVLTKYTRIKGTEVQVIKEEGVWVQVKDVNIAGKVEYAWLVDKYDTRKHHYTVNEAYIDQVKGQFPGIDIDGEAATSENKERETSATHFKYKSGQGTSSRVITVAAGSAAQQYWIKKSFLIHNNEINAENCDLWSDNPDKVEVTSAGAVPYHCVVPSKEQITEDNVVWHRVEIGGVGGWIKEPEVVKVSPYDWLRCNFGVIKEQKDEGFSLFKSDSENDSRIDYEKLPTFFKQIFDRIDSNHDKIISDQELRNVMQDPRWAHYLAHMICYHQTEWCADGHAEAVERVKRQLGQDAAERLKTRIRQVCWWDAVSERPGSKQLYHWSPVAFIEHMRMLGDVGLTFEQLRAIATHATTESINAHLSGINMAIKNAEIDTCLKVVHFLAQLIAESGSFVYTSELISEEQAQIKYKGYKGRGLIQVTFKKNYEAYGNFVHEDFISSRDAMEKLEKPPHAAGSAGWYWSKNNLNEPADRNDFLFVCYAVNGGFNGCEHHRLPALKKAVEVLCSGDINTDYKFAESKIYHDLKACYGWGLWHDPSPGDAHARERIGCTADKTIALEGYKRFIEVLDASGKAVGDWYRFPAANIRAFVENRIEALSS